MGKGSGGTRNNAPEQKAANRSEYSIMVNSGLAKKGMSYYDSNSGGYMVWMKGHKEENGKRNPEYVAAKILAENGCTVILTPEGEGKAGAISIKRNAKGNKTYVDGKIDMQTYEQHTPTVGGKAEGVLSSLTHGHDKGSDIVLIHDYHNVLHRTDIQKGIDAYNKWVPKNGGKRTQFKAIIVVNAKKEVYDWYL